MNKEKRMIYKVDVELFNKISELRQKYSLNISALIRTFLEKKYKEITK